MLQSQCRPLRERTGACSSGIDELIQTLPVICSTMTFQTKAVSGSICLCCFPMAVCCWATLLATKVGCIPSRDSHSSNLTFPLGASSGKCETRLATKHGAFFTARPVVLLKRTGLDQEQN